MISVCLTVVNELELSKKCIESIQKYTTGEFEISVCDNGSSLPEVKDWLDSLFKSGEIRLTRFPTNKGCGPSWNSAINNSNKDSEFIAIVHNDSTVIKDWREMLTSPINNDVVFVGTERCGNDVSNRYVPGVIDKDRVFLAGPIYVIKHSVLLDSRMLIDEQFVPIYFDDMDWMLRFKLAGYKLFVVNERFPHVEYTTTRRVRTSGEVSDIIYKNENRLHRKLEGTFVSHLSGWSYITTPNDRYTWIHLNGKEFGQVDRETNSVVHVNKCVAPYRVPNDLCSRCNDGSCWKRLLPKEEIDFVAKYGSPLSVDFPLGIDVKGRNK